MEANVFDLWEERSKSSVFDAGREDLEMFPDNLTAKR